jgi:hypothetical protein
MLLSNIVLGSNLQVIPPNKTAKEVNEEANEHISADAVNTTELPIEPITEALGENILKE